MAFVIQVKGCTDDEGSQIMDYVRGLFEAHGATTVLGWSNYVFTLTKKALEPGVKVLAMLLLCLGCWGCTPAAWTMPPCGGVRVTGTQGRTPYGLESGPPCTTTTMEVQR